MLLIGPRAGGSRRRGARVSPAWITPTRPMLQVASRAELSAKLFHEHIAPQLGTRQLREFGAAELVS